MLWTIGVLAVGALFAGLLEIPQVTHGMRNFLEPTIPARDRGDRKPGSRHVGAGRRPRARRALRRARAVGPAQSTRRGASRARRRRLERVLQEKFGFDLLYDWAFYRPAAAIASGGQRLWEQRVVIGSMDAVSATGSWTSRLLSIAQSGLVRVYALAIAVGIAALAAWLMTGAS